MPLPVHSSEPLNIPASAFNEDDLTVIFLSGGRYGGDWVISASIRADGDQLGTFTTDAGLSRPALVNDPHYPDLAIETAFIWLMSEARKHGWRVVSFECLNDQYREAERPYFCVARAIIASEQFKPAPGVTYADQMTLDAVMGYRN